MHLRMIPKPEKMTYTRGEPGNFRIIERGESFWDKWACDVMGDALEKGGGGVQYGSILGKFLK